MLISKPRISPPQWQLSSFVDTGVLYGKFDAKFLPPPCIKQMSHTIAWVSDKGDYDIRFQFAVEPAYIDTTSLLTASVTTWQQQ